MSTTPWQWLRIGNIVLALICGAMAIDGGQGWSGMVNAGLCGFNVASAMSVTMHIRMIRSFEQMTVLLNAMRDLNGDLLMMLEQRDEHEAALVPEQPRPAIN